MDTWETERKHQQTWPPDLAWLLRWWTEGKPIIHRGMMLNEAEKITDPEAYRASIQAMVDENQYNSAKRSGQLRDMLAKLYAACGTLDISYEYHRRMPTFDLRKKRRDLELTGAIRGRDYRACVRVLEERAAQSA